MEKYGGYFLQLVESCHLELAIVGGESHAKWLTQKEKGTGMSQSELETVLITFFKAALEQHTIQLEQQSVQTMAQLKLLVDGHTVMMARYAAKRQEAEEHQDLRKEKECHAEWQEWEQNDI